MLTLKTGKSILSNIYPQQEGLPVYNPSGKYWVRLYYLGKARKVEIDDVFTFDAFTCNPALTLDKFLYPMAEFANILWPLIFAKALYKLFAFKWKADDPSQEVGDGAIMYSLTGLLPCTFSSDAIKKGRLG